ncbi:MAG: MFS transporter, partial [Bacillota bacterium]|nr:MFS transporter [Bacillota bacterium]
SIVKQYRGLKKEIYIIFTARVVNSMGSFVYPLLALIMTQKIGLSTARTGTLITTVSIFTGLSMIIGGKVADSFGRKRVILLFQGLAAIVFIICGFLKPNISLVYFIMAAPILNAIAQPAQDAMIIDLTEPGKRREALSLLYMGHNLGFAIGPVIGGLLYRSHLPLVFIGDGLTTLASLTLLALFVKETIKSDEDEIKTEERVLERSEKGSVFSVLLKRPILLYFALIMFVYQFSYAQWGFTLPLQLGKIYGTFGGTNYGILGGINGAVVICLTPLIVRLTHSIKPLFIMGFGGLMYAIAFGSFAFIRTMPLFIIFIIIMTIGEISISINGSTFVANHTPASHRGRVSAAIQLIFGAGSAISPMIMGKYIAAKTISSGWILISIIMLISCSFMFLLDKMDRPIEVKEENLNNSAN